MLVHKVNCIDDQYIRVSKIVSDPHGQFVGLFIEDTLKIVEIREIFEHFN